MKTINIFWFRRDLRYYDNHGLHHALKSDHKVLPIFIFDTEILDQLENKQDKRLDYIQQALEQIHKEFQKYRSGLQTFFGKPAEIFEQLISDFDIDTVFTNHDYEPYAKARDLEVENLLKENNIGFKSYKDQVIFEKDEIIKKDKNPYTIYTPYSKKWKELFEEKYTDSFHLNFDQLFQYGAKPILTLQDIGFEKTDLVYEKPVLDEKQIEMYDKTRNFPGKDSTSRIGVAVRFGTISVRECISFALKHNEVWLNELIWREFFMQILYHFPIVVHHCFKEEYEKVAWRNNEAEFQRWCAGETGYPIVDAGMRQLNETGFMHNRVRMITASFLTKHLLVDWRWGEAYFAEKLLDYELSSNNGNWQWVAGCGCDSSPFFRIFNPEEQTKKFDKFHQYINEWRSKTSKKLEPIVEHKAARDRALEVYRAALRK